MSAGHDEIKDLAYKLWQEAGSPHGRDMDFWLSAEAQLKPVPAKPAKAASKPKAEPKAKAEAKPKAAPKPKAPAKKAAAKA